MAGRRYSRQRELIYHALMESKEHPTAEMLYAWLKPSNPNLSLGTVYRNLNLLAEEGIIVRMPFSVERYDATTAPHPHFRCVKCGCVKDIELPYEQALDTAARKVCGDWITGHALTYYGVCTLCGNAD